MSNEFLLVVCVCACNVTLLLSFPIKSEAYSTVTLVDLGLLGRVLDNELGASDPQTLQGIDAKGPHQMCYHHHHT